MKALVIGGNGFIGSHLVDRFIQQQWEVTVLDSRSRCFDKQPPGAQYLKKELDDSLSIIDYLSRGDIVFNLAWTTTIESANRDPISDLKTNLIPFLHLLNACRQAEVRKLVFISTGGAIYGLPNNLPVAETHELNPINAYGVSKLAAEKYLKMFSALYGLDYAILRPSSAYGPRHNPKGKQGAVNVFLYRVAHGIPVTIWGDGGIIRDYIYITDLIDALCASATHIPVANRIFNISGAEKISLIELLRLVEEIVEKKAIIEYYPARDFDAPDISLDTRLAQKELDWHPRVLLSEGLLSTWDWLKSVEI